MYYIITHNYHTYTDYLLYKALMSLHMLSRIENFFTRITLVWTFSYVNHFVALHMSGAK